MKKILTVSIFFMVFSALVIGQAVFDYFDSVADQNSKDQEEKAFYLDKFKNLKIESSDILDVNKKTSKPLDFSELKNKVVIINFWASWCKPCLEELPSLVKLRNKIPSEKLEILAINSDEHNQAQEIKKISKRFGINFKIVYDLKGKYSEMFDISAIPVTFIFIKSELHLIKRGQLDFFSEEMIELINQNIK